MFFAPWLALLLLCMWQPGVSWAAPPRTGKEVPALSSFDRMVEELLAKYGVPGAAVAVVKDERLVFARGYGYADVEKKEPVQPDALFRIASISKPITAVAILRLVEQGKLKLEDKAFSYIADLKPAPGQTETPGIRDVTIEQLLQHTGGWDRLVSFDPMFRSQTVAQAVGVEGPSSCVTVIRYMMSLPFDFSPGSRFAYSNFGYCILGRVIEKVTGQTYEAYLKQEILKPMGISKMRIGATLLEGRAPGEVKYYHEPENDLADSVFPGITEKVPWPYGGFYLEAMDSHGAWIASAVDLLRFITSVDGRTHRPDLLKSETIQKMVARPSIWEGSAYFYAMGWLVRPSGNDANWWHDGSLLGTTTLLVRTHHGYSWSILMNFRPQVGDLGLEADQGMWKAFQEVTQWPTHDLFADFPNENTKEPTPEQPSNAERSADAGPTETSADMGAKGGCGCAASNDGSLGLWLCFLVFFFLFRRKQLLSR